MSRLEKGNDPIHRWYVDLTFITELSKYSSLIGWLLTNYLKYRELISFRLDSSILMYLLWALLLFFSCGIELIIIKVLKDSNGALDFSENHSKTMNISFLVTFVSRSNKPCKRIIMLSHTFIVSGDTLNLRLFIFLAFLDN